MAKVEVVMPQMGESVMEGTVIEWSKEIGDSIEVDETLLEIATDKVDTEVPSPESGILIEILAGEGDTIEVGQAIAVIETDAEKAAEATSDAETGESEEAPTETEETEEEQSDENSDPSEEERENEAPAPAGSGETDGERIDVVMPAMGESVMEGTVIEWSKSVGDTVEVDETLLEIATDKVDTEVPSPESGILIEILANEGDTVEVGQTIAVISKGEAAATASGAAAAATISEEGSGKDTSDEPAETAPSRSSEEISSTGDDGRFYSPLVRSIAKEEGISKAELEQIEGSGKGGRVTKEDVLAWLNERDGSEATSRPAEDPSMVRARAAAEGGSKGKISAGELEVKRPEQSVEVIKMDRMRKMIAEHMVRSKQTSAHVSTFAEVDVTSIVEWRNRNKASFQEKAGVKLTYTPIFVEAIIQAIQEFPLINSSVEGDEIHLKKDINFGLAVALGEGGKGGLIVPVIKQAQEKNLVGLAKVIHEVADKARNKDLKPDDLVGGTITLTNYGSVGNLMGTPIINQPQVAIIGTGVITKRPVVIESGGQDVIAIRNMMFISMSYDHRIIDGAHGGAYLSRVKELLENFDANRPI
ncbi:MAG: 2-oxoglutarate dehydrogenase, E2 component, dihydrolipoamide succinyltransferase [Bacteroidota bacterium]